MKQSTIAQSVECTGVGLHSGCPCRIRLMPGPVDSGIVFVSRGLLDQESRTRLVDSGCEIEIPALIQHVRSSSRATTLARATTDPESKEEEGAGAIGVATVEHLLASLYALEIDNVRVVIEGPEIPAMDGSAAPFFEWADSAGRVFSEAERRVFSLEESIEIRDGNRSIRADPAKGLRISYAIDFDHALIGRQALEMPRLDKASFRSELAAARTFGFEGEVEALQKSGLGLGGSLDNTVVLGTSGILNSDGLRYSDEFVRHKVIDLVGDLALLGIRLEAHVQVERGGHALHHALVRALAVAVSDRSRSPGRVESCA